MTTLAVLHFNFTFLYPSSWSMECLHFRWYFVLHWQYHWKKSPQIIFQRTRCRGKIGSVVLFFKCCSGRAGIVGLMCCDFLGLSSACRQLQNKSLQSKMKLPFFNGKVNKSRNTEMLKCFKALNASRLLLLLEQEEFRILLGLWHDSCKKTCNIKKQNHGTYFSVTPCSFRVWLFS